jgi:NAD(P)-dependent dehydrogenase (short-subunit alcohol dehydrogenase family)
MKKELRGQVALITGGSRGIGFGIARSLLAQGLHVAITGRDESGLGEAKRRLEAAGSSRVETFAVDVRDYEAIAQTVDRIVGAFGGLDVVVNNAGIGRFVNIADMTPEQWSEIIDTNVTGVFNVCHAALPVLRKRGGYIINISSLAGKNPFVGAGAYCASKAALNQFSEVLNQEVRHDDIKVTNIAPGSVATRFADGDEERGADWKIATSDIGDLVVDLLQLDRRTLPSYIELRPSKPPKK